LAAPGAAVVGPAEAAGQTWSPGTPATTTSDADSAVICDAEAEARRPPNRRAAVIEGDSYRSHTESDAGFIDALPMLWGMLASLLQQSELGTSRRLRRRGVPLSPRRRRSLDFWRLEGGSDMAGALRLVVVGDRRKFGELLEPHPDIEITAVLERRSEALRAIDLLRPDAVLLARPEARAATIRKLKEQQPELLVVAVVGPSQDDEIVRMFAAGADACIAGLPTPAAFLQQIWEGRRVFP
jgi:CheY-like chemotaxis protein